MLNRCAPLSCCDCCLGSSNDASVSSCTRRCSLCCPGAIKFRFPRSTSESSKMCLGFFIPVVSRLRGGIPKSNRKYEATFVALSNLAPMTRVGRPARSGSILIMTISGTSGCATSGCARRSCGMLSSTMTGTRGMVSKAASTGSSRVMTLSGRVSSTVDKLGRTAKLSGCGGILGGTGTLGRTRCATRD